MRRRLQGAEVVENLPVVVHDAVAFAFGMEYGRQPFVVGAREDIAVAESADVALFHAGKKPVEPVVEVVAAALAQGHAHAEADDAAHAGFDAVVEHAAQVLLGVVDERQDGREPHDGGDAGVAQGFQRPEALARGADVGFYPAAEGLVAGGEGHLHHALGLAVDAAQQVEVAQHAGRLGDEREAEAVAVGQLQGPADKAELLFERNVWVGHRAGAQHAAGAPATERLFEQFRGVGLDLYVVERVGETVAGAARVAVDAAVGAAAVEVHAVLRRQDRPGLDRVHGYSSPSRASGATSSDENCPAR